MTEIDQLLALGVLLVVKHSLADGPLQTGRHVAMKGRFLHPAGLEHAAIHAGLTALVLALWMAGFGLAPADFAGGLGLLAGLVAAEFALHYLIDWTKSQADRRFGWSHPETRPGGQTVLVIERPGYFHAFLVDQAAHSLTYFALLFILSRVG